MNKIIGFSSILYVALFLKKYSDSVAPGTAFSKFANIFFAVGSVIFILSIIVALFLAHKRGYGDKEWLKRFKPLFIMIPICIVFILFLVILLKLDENNMLP